MIKTNTEKRWVDFYMRKMGLKIDGNPVLSITLHDVPEKDEQHQYWRLLGKEVFRAAVSGLLIKYHPAKGQVLQQVLGNTLSKKSKIKYFDDNHFFSKTVIPEKLNIAGYKHIIVEAFLGYLTEYLNEDELNTYILNNWLAKTWTEKKKKTWTDLKLQAKSKGIELKKTLSDSLDEKQQKIHTGQLLNAKTGEILLEITGNSRKYVNKKLIRKGFNLLK